VSSVTYNPLSSAPTLPKRIASFLARVSQVAWWPIISPDEVERRYINDVSEAEVPGDWGKLGVEPDVIEAHALKYLKRYRSA
jgi:NADH dehydrogenase (ubiquinone) 1 alpha subcomplex subunit 9